MNTRQNYDASASGANAPTFNESTATGSNLLMGVDCQFVDDMHKPEVINRLRQDVRAWFSAYVPVQSGSYSLNSLEESIQAYEMLDQFFSLLVEAGISQLKGGQDNA